MSRPGRLFVNPPWNPTRQTAGDILRREEGSSAMGQRKARDRVDGLFIGGSTTPTDIPRPCAPAWPGGTPAP